MNLGSFLFPGAGAGDPMYERWSVKLVIMALFREKLSKECGSDYSRLPFLNALHKKRVRLSLE